MKRKNLGRESVLKIFFGLFLIATFLFVKMNQSIAEELVTLKISLQPYISQAPVFIALEEGYFREQGLDIEFVEIKGSEQSVPALARGYLDVGTHATGSSLFAAVSKGLKIKVVGDKVHLEKGINYFSIIARKDLYDSGKLTTIEQLRGKKVALLPIPVWGYVYEEILRAGNLTLDDIEIVRIPSSARIEAFKTGAIDAASMVEPLLTQLETLEYAVRLVNVENFFPNYQVASVIFGPNLTEKNPEAGKKFMIAYLKGVRQYNKGKTERNLKIFQKYTGLDMDILQRMNLPAISSYGYVNTESILACQDWVYEKGFIDSKVTADQLVDMSFAEYANRVLESMEQ